MTASEQIKALIKAGCEDAIREIKCNQNRPLPANRLNHHIEIAIGTGLVMRVVALSEIMGGSLSHGQVERLTRRCLELEWVVDALCAAKQGLISDETRWELVRALISHQLAGDAQEAMQLLTETE